MTCQNLFEQANADSFRSFRLLIKCTDAGSENCFPPPFDSSQPCSGNSKSSLSSFLKKQLKRVPAQHITGGRRLLSQHITRNARSQGPTSSLWFTIIEINELKSVRTRREIKVYMLLPRIIGRPCTLRLVRHANSISP